MLFIIEADEEPTEITFKGKSIKLTRVDECYTCGLITASGRFCPIQHDQ